MRKWGVVISVFYAVIVLGLIVPAAVFLVGVSDRTEFLKGIRGAYQEWILWIPIAIVILGQAMLLFVSVDTSQKRLKPRAHLLVSSSMAGLLTALLGFAAIFAVGVAARGDKFGEGPMIDIVFGLLWLFWGVVFYLYFRNSSAMIDGIMSWLLRGSVLELLIVVPCHVIVRRRHECSAPIVTSFGIATGIAIMLLSFGPSVLLLYKKRLDEYAPRS